MTIRIVHHASCPDGFTAAWIAWHYFVDQRHEVELHPGVYERSAPDGAGETVVIVDFSYSPEELVALCGRAEEVWWLDHHASAIDAWNRHLAEGGAWPLNLRADLDLNRSGALITWDWFTSFSDGLWFPRVSASGQRSRFGYRVDAIEMREIVERIDARDRWQKNPDGTWALDGTAEVLAALTSRPYEIEEWDDAFALGLDGLVAEGASIERYRQQLIDQAVANAYPATIAGHPVHVANAPYAICSDVCERLNGLHPDEALSGCWFTDGAEQKWSIRSRQSDGIDVAAIAAMFGGGGHTHAAGFRIAHDALGDGLAIDAEES